MAEQTSEYMSEHIPGLKLILVSQHMSDRKHVRDVRTQSRTFPSLYDRLVRAQTRFDARTRV